MILHAFLGTILFIVLPIVAGYGLYYVLNKNRDLILSRDLILGYILMWSVIELIAIPITILKLSFFIVVGITIIIMLLFFVIGIKKLYDLAKDSDIKIWFSKHITKENVIGLLLLLGVFFYTVFRLETTLFVDDDDSRFIVNAVDIVRTHRVLATNPTTGLPISSNYADFYKDLVAQWSSFIAFSSMISKMHITIFAHTVYPVIALLLLGAVAYQIIDLTSGEQKKSFIDKSICISLLYVLFSFGYYSIMSVERFTMTRVWQGKGTYAGIGLLILIYGVLVVNKTNHLKSDLLIIILINISLCLMTSMSIIITPVVLMVYAFVTGIIKKDWKIIIYFACICLINVGLYLLSHYYTIESFIN